MGFGVGCWFCLVASCELFGCCLSGCELRIFGFLRGWYNILILVLGCLVFAFLIGDFIVCLLLLVVVLWPLVVCVCLVVGFVRTSFCCWLVFGFCCFDEYLVLICGAVWRFWGWVWVV